MISHLCVLSLSKIQVAHLQCCFTITCAVIADPRKGLKVDLRPTDPFTLKHLAGGSRLVIGYTALLVVINQVEPEVPSYRRNPIQERYSAIRDGLRRHHFPPLLTTLLSPLSSSRSKENVLIPRKILQTLILGCSSRFSSIYW